MPETSTIGVAFLGVGRMGETHLRNLVGLSGVRVVAVADPNGEAAERGKVLANAEVALTDIEKAIAHAGVDAVVIVTPTETHARLIEIAVQAGKAVFSEKPIASQKTPLLFARDFASSYDHFENFPDRFDKAYRLHLESFFQDLQAGRKPSPGPDDALETLRLAIAVTKSWREGRPVKVSEIQ
jgi:predicted dehydrogenase